MDSAYVLDSYAIMALLENEDSANRVQALLEAGRLKSQYPVAYADCFAVALAMEKKATIITGDIEFKRFEKRVKIEWI